MARSKGNVTNSAISKARSGNPSRTVTGYQGKSGNASIKRSSGTSARQDMKAKTTGSNIKASRNSPYDPGMHK